MFLACIIVCQAAGWIGSLATIPAIPTWYAALKKPVFTPPNWIFGPVWTTLYFLMGVSLFLVINQQTRLSKTPSLILFGIQLILNVTWSFVFFGMQAPGLALIEILLLTVSIGATILFFMELSSLAAYLLVPYLLWVIYASALNTAIWILNR
ncbi:tryptophan-rich sensory protein [bacterium]|nr:tryptophan-rich sensory protein [candidate division CSSED10-310 bacterium]